MESTKYIYWQDRASGSATYKTILTTGRKGNRSKTCKSTFAICTRTYQVEFRSGSEVIV
jgi:hypothetical protein